MAIDIKLKDDTGTIGKYKDVSVIRLPTNDSQTAFASFKLGVAVTEDVIIYNTDTKTIIPTNPNTYISSVPVKVDPTNLVSYNIRKGVIILGVTGSYEGGGGSTPTYTTKTGKIVNNKQYYIVYPSQDGVDYYNGINLYVDVPVPAVVENYEYPEQLVANDEYTIDIPNDALGNKQYAHEVKVKVQVPTDTKVTKEVTYHEANVEDVLTPEQGNVFSQVTVNVDVPVLNEYTNPVTLSENKEYTIAIPDKVIDGTAYPQYAREVVVRVDVPTESDVSLIDNYEYPEELVANDEYTIDIPVDSETGKQQYAKSFTVKVNAPTAETYSVTETAIRGSIDPIVTSVLMRGSFSGKIIVADPPSEGTGLPETISVTGAASVVYSSETGDFTVTNIYDDVVLEAICDGKHYSFSFNATDGVITSDREFIYIDSDASLTFTPNESFNYPKENELTITGASYEITEGDSSAIKKIRVYNPTSTSIVVTAIFNKLKWPTPNVIITGDIAYTNKVEDAPADMKYLVYSDGNNVGYVDQNGTWHPTNT